MPVATTTPFDYASPADKTIDCAISADKKNSPPVGAFTVDVEEWFHAHNLDVPYAEWDGLPSRLDRPIDDLLTLLAEHGTQATFFVLGWVAKRSPNMVQRIHAAGHEIACHGYGHQSILRQSREEFREDIRRAKGVLEEVIGEAVVGYRAPSYSITRATLWALDELQAGGFTYDSSIYPARCPWSAYGIDSAPLHPFRIRENLWEFPLPTVNLMGARLPALTGAYLRLWPRWVTRLALDQNRRASIPVVLNVHPWELDPDQPRRSAAWHRRLRHYGNLRNTHHRTSELLRQGHFEALRHLHSQWNHPETNDFARVPPQAVAGNAERRFVEPAPWTS